MKGVDPRFHTPPRDGHIEKVACEVKWHFFDVLALLVQSIFDPVIIKGIETPYVLGPTVR